MSTAINYCNETWNIVTGCTHVSEGCRNCWAERLAGTRLRHLPRYRGLAVMENGTPKWTGEVRCHPDLLDKPLHWRTPRTVLVSSHGDLFHADVTFPFIKQVWDIAAERLDHTFWVLTKRPARALTFAHWMAGADDVSIAAWPRNVYIGVSVSNQQDADAFREPMRALAGMGCHTWVSYEPALSVVDWKGWEFLDWMVSGGESGPHARPSHPDCHREARDFCQEYEIPYFFKQWGEWIPFSEMPDIYERNGLETYQFPDGELSVHLSKKRAGRLLDGREWNEFPAL